MRTIEKKSCFVIMPFTKAAIKEKELNNQELEFIFEDLIKASVLEYRRKDNKVFIDVRRSEATFGSLISGIITSLNDADLVIADLTGINPNVMYELGVRHSLKRGTIIITQDISSLPSDLRDYACIEYNYSRDNIEQKENYSRFKDRLHVVLDQMVSGKKPDYPVLSYLRGKERYWKEDEAQKLRENIIIASYIVDNFDSINEVILEVLTTSDIEITKKLITRCALLINNLGNAMADLNISIETAILYEDMIAAKQMITEIQKEVALSDYFTGFIPTLTNENAPDFQALGSRFFNRTYPDYFGLLEGEYREISFQEIFAEEGDFKECFLDELEEYLTKKAKMLGLTTKEIDQILAS
jgi:hypothetical protein